MFSKALFYSALLVRKTRCRRFSISLWDMNRKLILLFVFVRGVLVLICIKESVAKMHCLMTLESSEK